MPHEFAVLLLLRSNLSPLAIDLLLTSLPLLNQLFDVFSEDPNIIHFVENLIPDIEPLLKLFLAQLRPLVDEELLVLLQLHDYQLYGSLALQVEWQFLDVQRLAVLFKLFH